MSRPILILPFMVHMCGGKKGGRGGGEGEGVRRGEGEGEGEGEERERERRGRGSKERWESVDVGVHV